MPTGRPSDMPPIQYQNSVMLNAAGAVTESTVDDLLNIVL